MDNEQRAHDLAILATYVVYDKNKSKGTEIDLYEEYLNNLATLKKAVDRDFPNK